MALVQSIPSTLNPDDLNDVLAKSADNGGDTLAEHTWAVLNRLADQYRLRPNLPAVVGDPRLWHRLYWGCLLHDFGKAARQFQDRLRAPKQKNQWAEERHRHEVLSLAFVDLAFPSGHPDRLPVIAVVIAHHRDFAGDNDTKPTVSRQYGTHTPDNRQIERVQFLVEQLDESVTVKLWSWFNNFGIAWARALGFGEADVYPVNVAPALVNSDNIRHCLSDFADYYCEREDGSVDMVALLRDLHYRGLILTADHAASAGSAPFPPFALSLEQALHPLESKNRALNDHQREMLNVREGSALLIAPTGSGKTEAALLWAAQQMMLRPAARLFYTLPYQASMNAMESRLKHDFFTGNPDFVTVQHSRATLKYYRDLMDADGGVDDPRAAAQGARAKKDRVRLNYYPVQVFSPYQMLKAAFRLRGYEPLLVDYTAALFIFDEIHAYDAPRLALIITMMKWLAQNYGARFLVMTATLPPMVRDALADALNDPATIRATSATFTASRRHRVHIRDGDVLVQLDQPFADWREGRSALVCCNTVARAQAAYIDLKRKFQDAELDPREHLLLLHGRFNGKDRHEKEQLLAARVGVGTANRRPMIVVATQVVEVSLNIDLDVLYTDPAPLEALLQRFGRINRGRTSGELCPVIVFKQPLGEKESRPYDYQIVTRSLEVLTQYCADQAIDEALVTEMLADIYQSDIRAGWQRAYDQQAKTFDSSLKKLVPYQSADPKLEEEFYKLFDGVDVLPLDGYDAWERAVDAEGYLGASQYLVNIGWKQLMRLKSTGNVLPKEEKQYFYQIAVPYTEEFGLDLNNLLGGDDDT